MDADAPAGMLPVASAKQPVVAGASSPGSWRALLLAAGAVVLCCLVLTQVAAVAPWRPITAPNAWQLHANRSEQQAASLAAQPLEQLQQRQQQQQLEEQQRWKELKQQHDQQTQALSAVQQVQQEVHAGVQKLQQEFGNLVNSTLASVAQHMPSSAQQEAGNTTHQGVICTVLRNEAKYVPEWVAFHLLLGATKVVIYDDNSTDALKEATAPFGDSVAVINMYKDVTGVPGDNSVHRVGARQGWAFAHCKKTFAPPNGTGWLGVWDVDEFVYPCRRPNAKLPHNAVWEAYVSSTNVSAHGHQLHCSLFGQNHNDTTQGNDTLVLLNNIRRATDGLTEPAGGPKLWEAVAPGCDKCGGCCQISSAKAIYDISKVQNLALGTHGPHGNAVMDQSWQKPLSGLCCNHYQFKSTEESQSKTAANLNDHYTKVANTPDAKKHLTMVLDTLIWQYVPDMLQLLQQKGFHFKVPKVPALINRHKKHR